MSNNYNYKKSDNKKTINIIKGPIMCQEPNRGSHLNESPSILATPIWTVDTHFHHNHTNESCHIQETN